MMLSVRSKPINHFMSYSVLQLAKLAGVTVRTLHHYDRIGLLTPARKERNKYREYGEAELLKLQQIMFFRELDFPLEEIKAILSNPNFDILSALTEHRKLISLKRNRMSGLLKTIDKTIKKINKEKPMDDHELYGGFSKEKAEEYATEAKERWGHTDVYKQSQERAKKLTKEDWARMSEESDAILKAIVANMDKGPKSTEVQEQIAKHYNSLRAFYEPNVDLYRGLADMYVADERFAANYEKYHKDLPQFMRDAMHAYADANS